MTAEVECCCPECGAEFSAKPEGGHRLLCGDSTVATDVERVLGGVEPHLMVTDPPYGVEYDPGWRNRPGVPRQHPGKSREQRVVNDDRADWLAAWDLFPGSVAYIWHSGTFAHVTAASLISAGFEIRAQIIWTKHQFVLSRGHYHPQHEPCLYAVKRGSTGHWSGDRKQSTVWAISSARGFVVKCGEDAAQAHGTQKPVECMKRPIENNSSPGQAVYEPFSGSGTTIVAAEMTGRVAHAIELSPLYVDVAIKRWQDFAGKQATLDGDGRSFDDIAATRKPLAA